MHLTEDKPQPRRFARESDSDLSAFRESLDVELPAWSPENKGASGSSVAAESSLTRVELKNAIESLIDPKFRFNIAGRDFAAAVGESRDLEEDVLTLVGDVFKLVIRRVNARIDGMFHCLTIRVLWAKLLRRRDVVECLMKDIPFMVREVVLVRPDGSVASGAKRPDADAKLKDLLASGGNVTLASKSRRAERKAASKTFSRLAAVAGANKSPRQKIVYYTRSRFAIAASVQGLVPRRFHKRMALTLRAIEGEVKAGSPGAGLDPKTSRRVGRHLNEILDLTAHRLSVPFPWMQSLAVSAIIALGAVFTSASFDSMKEARWRNLVAEIESLPGIDLKTASAASRPRIIEGFRDPLASDPLPLIAKNGFGPEEVSLSFRPCQSADDSIVEQRARYLLRPPDSVTFRLENGTIFANGSASHQWLRDCRRQSHLLLPQTQLDLSGVVDVTLLSCRTAAEQLLPLHIDFDPAGRTSLIARESELTRTADLIRSLQQAALGSGIPLEIRLVGRHLDSTTAFGVEHLRIARERADHVRDLLLCREPAIDSLVLRAFGERPLPDSALDARIRNHAVEFVVSLDGETLTPGSVSRILEGTTASVSRPN